MQKNGLPALAWVSMWHNNGMDLELVSVDSVGRHLTAEQRWACLGSPLCLLGKEMSTNLPVLLGACAIPQSRFGGLSTAYSGDGWLRMIRDYCCGACWRRETTVHLEREYIERRVSITVFFCSVKIADLPMLTRTGQLQILDTYF